MRADAPRGLAGPVWEVTSDVDEPERRFTHAQPLTPSEAATGCLLAALFLVAFAVPWLWGWVEIVKAVWPF